MNIIKSNLKFNTLYKRAKTLYLILHHRAGNGDIQSLHEDHLKKGYAGCGYQFYIRKDGSVNEGRPIDVSGAHTENYNSISVGVAFEGNFMNDEMNEKQFNAGIELIKYLKELYPNTEIKGHKELNPTACPGVNFPLDKFKFTSDVGGEMIEHWAEQDYQDLISTGIHISEKRFDDTVTRAEMFAMFNKFRKSLG